jgi:hypothetical protein
MGSKSDIYDFEPAIVEKSSYLNKFHEKSISKGKVSSLCLFTSHE